MSAFSVWPFRFHFRATEPILFPTGKASNILRGAFGTIFRKLACVPSCRDAKSCEIVHTCPYALLFEPRQEWTGIQGPSGFADQPRPFVFRAMHLDGCRLTTGQPFYFDLILFEHPAKSLPYFVLVFRQLVETGLGPSRGRASLSQVEELATGMTLYDGRQLLNRDLPGLAFGFEEQTQPINRLTVNFLTPTELKSAGTLVERPEFPVLLSRLRDRISNLRAIYQGGPLSVDFESLGQAAQHVRIVNSDLRHVQAERLSSRTGQRHSIGGFTGSVTYEGAFSTFLPFFQVGEWTGVGRQCVWGKGVINISTAIVLPVPKVDYKLLDG